MQIARAFNFSVFLVVISSPPAHGAPSAAALPSALETNTSHRPALKTDHPQLAQAGGKAAVSGSGLSQRGTVNQGRLHLILSLAWEGRDLRPENLAAIDGLRQRYPGLQVMHFISPAYLVRDSTHAEQYAKLIQARILPGDSVGLLLNGWKSVVTAAGVNFRSHPTFWGSPLRAVDCQQDCGLEVPINVYPSLDLSKLISFGRKTLVTYGFAPPVAIQTSGWVASPQVLATAAAEGLRYDYSAVPIPLIHTRSRHFPLYAWVKNLWKDIGMRTEPFSLNLGPDTIVQVPQSLATVDYLQENDRITAVESWVALARERGASERQTTVTLGLYQETSDAVRARTHSIIDSLYAAAEGQRITIIGSALPGPNALGVAPTTVTEATEPSTPVAQATNAVEPPTVEPALRREERNRLKEPPKVH